MKRIYLLMILFVAFAGNAFAHRSTDLSVTLVSPTTATILNPGGSFAVDAIVKNESGDSIQYTQDSLLWYMSIGNGLVNITINGNSGAYWLTYHKQLKVGDTMHYKFPTLTPTGYVSEQDSNRTYCFYTYPKGKYSSTGAPLDTLKDPTTGNNKGCASFLWKKTQFPGGVKPVGYGTNNVVLYPNPANDYAVIGFDVHEAANVSLRIYDATGRVVSTMDKGQMQSGPHSLPIDTKNLPNGVYVYELHVGNDMSAGRLTVEKQ